MPKYHNNTSTPLALDLPNKEAMSLPPRQWVSLVGAQASSSMLNHYVREGLVTRFDEVAAEVAPVAAVPAPNALVALPEPASDVSEEDSDKTEPVKKKRG